MMKIRLIWVGRTKERALAERIEHYRKLLSGYVKLAVLEIKEERGREPSEVRRAEGRRILAATEHYLLLDERGREMNSPDFARYLGRMASCDVVLGGAFGVSDDVRTGARDCIALSRMTFTHEMARMITLEQIYRAMTILKGKEYHH